MVGSGANVYGGVDWVAIGMSASEDADLLNPKVRHLRMGTQICCFLVTWSA